MEMFIKVSGVWKRLTTTSSGGGGGGTLIPGPPGPQGPMGPPGRDGILAHWAGIWSSSNTYNMYDAVLHNGIYWISAIDSNTNEPGTGSDWYVWSSGLFNDLIYTPECPVNIMYDESNDELIKGVIKRVNSNLLVKQELDYYDDYHVLSSSYSKSFDNGQNYVSIGMNVYSWDENDRVIGYTWWTGRGTEGDIALVKCYFINKLFIDQDTTWSNTVSDVITFQKIVQNLESLRIFLENEEALDAVIINSTGMNVLASDDTAVQLIGFTTFAYQKIGTTDMAIGKYTAKLTSLQPVNYSNLTTLLGDSFATYQIANKVNPLKAIEGSDLALQIAVGIQSAMNLFANVETSTSFIVNSSRFMNAICGSTIASKQFATSFMAMDKIVRNNTAMQFIKSSQIFNDEIKISSVALQSLDSYSPIVVPTLTGPSFKVLQSSQNLLYPSWRVFDGDLLTSWRSEDGQVSDQWISYEFDENVWCYKVSIKAFGNDSSPKNCKVQYYDGSSWVDATTPFVVENTTGEQSFTVCKAVQSKFWRILFINNYGSAVRMEVGKVQFYCY